MAEYRKGEYNEYHCEIWCDDEFVGDVRTDDADKFVKLLNKQDKLIQGKNRLIKAYEEYFQCLKEDGEL